MQMKEKKKQEEAAKKEQNARGGPAKHSFLKLPHFSCFVNEYRVLWEDNLSQKNSLQLTKDVN